MQFELDSCIICIDRNRSQPPTRTEQKTVFPIATLCNEEKSAYRTNRPLNGKNSLKRLKRNVVICKDLPAKMFISTPGEMPSPFFSALTQAEVNASRSRRAYDTLTQTLLLGARCLCLCRLAQ